MATPAGVTVALNAKKHFFQRFLAFAKALRLHASWAACALTDRKMRNSGEYARGERPHVLSLIGCTLNVHGLHCVHTLRLLGWQLENLIQNGRVGLNVLKTED